MVYRQNANLYESVFHLDFLGNVDRSEKFVLLVIPKNASTTNAPWIPNMNHDKPQFYTRLPVRETQLLSVRLTHFTRHSSSAETRESNGYLACTSMELLGNTKATLQEIRGDLLALKAKCDQAEAPKSWDKQLESRIRGK